MSTKNSNDTIGNRTRDLPACRAVPQQTAPLRAPSVMDMKEKYRLGDKRTWCYNIKATVKETDFRVWDGSNCYQTNYKE
jgi:hypothetical protein